jgi:tRNA dimethylallyltransferase
LQRNSFSAATYPYQVNSAMPDSKSQTSATDQVLPDYSKWILPSLKHCWYLTGPTSSGKTPLSLEIARRLNAEIISLDSMAIYRGMDIGTAKPTPAQQAEIPHHQLDICDPTESYSVSAYVASTHRIAAEIHSRGRNVLICGGTPLYLKSLLRGLFLGPPADWEFREAVELEVANQGMDALRERLRSVDPLLADKLHPNDRRRMIRALEVAKITGVPLSHWQEQFERPARVEDCPTLVLKLDRAWLHQLINQRVQRMIDGGLATEVDSLLARYGELGRTACQAVGYREIISAKSQSSDASAEEIVELIRAHTRQFARRQEIWFRGLKELQPLVVTPETELDQMTDAATAFYSQYPQPIS